MKEIEVRTRIVLKQEEELSDEEKQLLEAAKEATKNSYAPYSHFHVGAAVLLDNGEIMSGSNQENCAYPSGLCAERTTVFYANSLHPDTPINILCVCARDSSGDFTSRPCPPCGACRQVLVETEQRFGKPMRVLLFGKEGTYCLDSAADLLPLSFDSDFL